MSLVTYLQMRGELGQRNPREREKERNRQTDRSYLAKDLAKPMVLHLKAQEPGLTTR